jgi:hypothetical protein
VPVTIKPIATTAKTRNIHRRLIISNTVGFSSRAGVIRQLSLAQTFEIAAIEEQEFGLRRALYSNRHAVSVFKLTDTDLLAFAPQHASPGFLHPCQESLKAREFIASVKMCNASRIGAIGAGQMIFCHGRFDQIRRCSETAPGGQASGDQRTEE